MAAKEKGTRIIGLVAENIKRISVVSITPKGDIVQITGKNAQGKTSVLDCILMAFGGEKVVPGEPIRRGEDKGRIEITLGSGEVVEFIVERRFTEKGSYLSVKTADGAKYPHPQDMLNDMLGALTLDPVGFMRMKREDQFKVLRQLVKLNEDPDAIAALNKTDFDTRTRVNRDLKAKKLQVEQIVVPEDLPHRRIDEKAILDEIQEAATESGEIEKRRQRRQTVADEIITARETAAAKRLQAAALFAEADEFDTLAASNEKRLSEAAPLPDPIDVAALRIKLDDARTKNIQIDDRRYRETLEAEAKVLEAEAERLTLAIQTRNEDLLKAIAAAKMPLADLSLGEGVVTYRGLPLDQASDAEQLAVSTAIAAASNPKLRVIRIRDGSLLDDDAWARLTKFAEEKDFQIWVETVRQVGDVAIEMVDGHVKE